MKCVLLWVLGLAIALDVAAQSPVRVDPRVRHQRIEGWGGSLCWWANIVGGWPESDQEEICTWITSPAGLNMNLFRFNIGGGDAPGHNHFRKDGGAMPGYRSAPGTAYNWNADGHQRAIALRLKAKCPAAIFEAFANSPPWWMTKSGCSSGNTNGATNLRENAYADFADYLTEVVRHYRDADHLVFRTLEPMNEPDASWWKALGKQEGCGVSVHKQILLIRAVHEKLSAKGLLAQTHLSAMDANSLDACLRTVAGPDGYAANQVLPLLSQINTHSYFGSRRQELAQFAAQQQKRLWQSESGPLHVAEKGLANHLVMAQRIITDLRDLGAVAWLDWQLVSERDPHWGLITADYGRQTYRRAKSFYVRMQFSRFFKPGYTVISTPHPATLAALSPASDTLVVLICHLNTASAQFQLDLSAFAALGPKAEAFRTSETEDCQSLGNLPLNGKTLHLTAPARSVTTVIIPVVPGR